MSNSCEFLLCWNFFIKFLTFFHRLKFVIWYTTNRGHYMWVLYISLKVWLHKKRLSSYDLKKKPLTINTWGWRQVSSLLGKYNKRIYKLTKIYIRDLPYQICIYLYKAFMKLSCQLFEKRTVVFHWHLLWWDNNYLPLLIAMFWNKIP